MSCINAKPMTFNSGVNNTTPNQKIIAFWIHTIDVFAGLADNCHSISVPTSAITRNDISEATYTATGTNSCGSFMGDTCEGFKLAIDQLSDEIKLPVKKYIDARLKSSTFIRSVHNPYDDEDDN